MKITTVKNIILIIMAIVFVQSDVIASDNCNNYVKFSSEKIHFVEGSDLHKHVRTEIKSNEREFSFIFFDQQKEYLNNHFKNRFSLSEKRTTQRFRTLLKI